MESGNANDGGSVISDDRNSAGSFASSAFCSFRCMFPFNIGFGSNTNGHGRLDLDDDEEIVKLVFFSYALKTSCIFSQMKSYE